MKLIRFGEAGLEKPGVELDGVRYDVSGFVNDYDEDFFAGDALVQLQSTFDKEKAPIVSNIIRLGAPVKRPGKIICIGLNYRKHAAESGMDEPAEPVVFFKATSSMMGPNDTIIIPKNSRKTDWEVELAVVIGKRANYISKEEALDHVAGYMLHNDVSEREFQIERGGQWVKGKSCDTFAPLGPYLVTNDEVADPNNMRLWLTLNGKKMQDGNTSDFIFNVQHVVSYLSQFMSLMPGDIISTGTPEGVGFGQKPPFYLKDGDVIELGIDDLGSAKQEVQDYAS
ncbi:fumarylacetoacetate hydrolase family protein [Algoriphagus aquimarinus]|uniref:2-keto-4-pentenoate hydratase/2-oxohepta-3-ene-1,7-dioic acid hydratase (Catechol pathway) n=1 Tax=Algoriphagus aquimarinus TaxID=237018 RepID=A0A1I1BUK6_9BACT|nr:fumarylacetoacetate hydrolase family protein [Algoriphagus aquimarinus]SFB53512.1 2-keto-4-pentenoate hydratase/2-oxohepta-3-ene-1,7-dioic acid hydratase (catechol pathway) [Algoriphagus aquimarinus]